MTNRLWQQAVKYIAKQASFQIRIPRKDCGIPQYDFQWVYTNAEGDTDLLFAGILQYIRSNNTTTAMGLIDLFAQGGYAGMSVITLLLVFVCFAGWKAPRWVMNIGRIALAAGAVWMLAGMMQMAGVLGENPQIESAVIWKGVRVTLIPMIYGIIVYVAAVAISTLQKERL